MKAVESERVIARGKDDTAVLAPSATVRDLNAVPVPDYDPYFSQFRTWPGTGQVTPDAARRNLARGSLIVRPDGDAGLHIEDTRSGLTRPRTATLTGWKAAVYQACDRSQLLGTLRDLPEVRSAGVGAGELREFLGRCVHYQVMVTRDGRYLSVAVHVPERNDSKSSAERTRATREG